MSLIALKNASKSYYGETALRDISLNIEDNTTTAIVGPSGGGKSTLLQLVNGLVRPDRGTVTVFGRPIDYDALTSLRLKIGYAVQGTGLFPHMRVWDNITLLARMVGWSGDRTRERAEHLMDLVGLQRLLATRYPHELSGGQQQRVGLCRAMMLNPEIFLLDEPFGALDPITREEIHREFLGLQRSEPRTIVLVTHDLREAVRLAKYLVILDRGELIQYDERDTVLRRPTNDFVRDLVHSQLASAEGDGLD